MLRILEPTGTLRGDVDPDLDPDLAVRLYRAMHFQRVLDTPATQIELQFRSLFW